MRKMLLSGLLLLGIETVIAQTMTPSPSQNPRSEHHRAATSHTPTTNNKGEKKKGSAGTYTTGAETPSPLPTDTPAWDKKERPKNINPDYPTKPRK